MLEGQESSVAMQRHCLGEQRVIEGWAIVRGSVGRIIQKR